MGLTVCRSVQLLIIFMLTGKTLLSIQFERIVTFSTIYSVISEYNNKIAFVMFYSKALT